MHPISCASLCVVVRALAQLASLFAPFDNMHTLPNPPWGPATSGRLTDQARLRMNCVGNICPWCILDARHGYLGEARRRFEHLTAELPHDSPPELLWILLHCRAWCERICDECPAVAGEEAGTSTGGAASSSWSTLPPPPPRPLRAAAASMQPRPPRTRPAAAPATSARHPGKGAAAPGPPADPWGVPLPGHLDAQWDFECWTGPSCKWVAYPEDTQEQLRAAYNAGGGILVVMVNGSHMEVSTTPDDMWQNNPSTSAKPRKVQLSPKGGWPE